MVDAAGAFADCGRGGQGQWDGLHPLADYGTDAFGVELYVLHFPQSRLAMAMLVNRLAPLRCYGAVTVPSRLSIETGELRKSIVGGPPNLASTIALHSPP